MSEKELDLSKPFKTLGGFEVEIVTDKGREPYPILGYIKNGRSDNPIQSWNRKGGHRMYSENNLVNVPPPKRKIFVNVFKKGEALTKQLEMDANFHAESWSQSKQEDQGKRDRYCFVAGYLAAKNNGASRYHLAECLTMNGQSITQEEKEQMKKQFPSYLGTFEIEVDGE